MSSKYLEEEKRKRAGESYEPTEPATTQPTFEGETVPRKTFSPWRWWKWLLLPLALQLVAWLAAVSFSSHWLSSFSNGQVSLGGFFATVPEDFPQELLPPDFELQQVVTTDQQRSLMGESSMSLSELAQWFPQAAKKSGWQLATQMPSPQGAVVVLTQQGKRLEVVLNGLSPEKTQVLSTLHFLDR